MTERHTHEDGPARDALDTPTEQRPRAHRPAGETCEPAAAHGAASQHQTDQQTGASSEAAEAGRDAGGGAPCGCDMPDEELLYDLADLFKVFSDTTRIKILYSLMEQPLAVGDIAQAIDATQSAVSHQLRILKQAHLVRFDRDGRSLIYSLADDHVHTMLSQGMTHICE